MDEKAPFIDIQTAGDSSYKLIVNREKATRGTYKLSITLELEERSLELRTS